MKERNNENAPFFRRCAGERGVFIVKNGFVIPP